MIKEISLVNSGSNDKLFINNNNTNRGNYKRVVFQLQSNKI